jgi:SAM-dependent methyltransferase
MSSQTIPSSASVNGVVSPGAALPKRSLTDRSQFLSILSEYTQRVGVDINSTVLVIGGTQDDAAVLRRCGFSRITLSNLEEGADEDSVSGMALDAENIRLPDNSYDMVLVHAVLHHCRSPHRALCEILRVAKRRVVMMEPNDSAFMRLLCWLRFSFPFEIAAVVDNDYARGGVRNSQIPNFIYRWSRHEVYKTASSFLAEYTFSLFAFPYWDFNVDERDLASREQTRISKVTAILGARNFLRLLRGAQRILNRVPILREQGNRFFCGVDKGAELRPWLVREDDNKIVFNRNSQQPASDIHA